MDVAVKALSPGINDPTTAIHALGHCSALLCELVGRDLGTSVLRDDDGRVRVILARPGFTDLLELAVGQARRYGAEDPVVLGRLFALLREVAWHATGDTAAAVVSQLDRLRHTADEQDFDSAERAALDEQAELVRAALAGRWPTSSSTGGSTG